LKDIYGKKAKLQFESTYPTVSATKDLRVYFSEQIAPVLEKRDYSLINSLKVMLAVTAKKEDQLAFMEAVSSDVGSVWWFSNCVGLEKGNNLESGDYPMSQRKRTTYTKEFKREAVNLVVEQGYSIAEASRNLGINYNMLSRWKNESQSNGEHAFPSKGYMTKAQAELSRLKAENKRLRMERDILKKATAFFAKEMK